MKLLIFLIILSNTLMANINIYIPDEGIKKIKINSHAFEDLLLLSVEKSQQEFNKNKVLIKSHQMYLDKYVISISADAGIGAGVIDFSTSKSIEFHFKKRNSSQSEGI